MALAKLKNCHGDHLFTPQQGKFQILFVLNCPMILSIEVQRSIFIPLTIILNITWIICLYLLFGKYSKSNFVKKRSVAALVMYIYGMVAFENAVILGWKIFQGYSSTVIPVLLIDFMGFSGCFAEGFGYNLLCLQYTILQLKSKYHCLGGNHSGFKLSWGEQFVLKLYDCLEWTRLDYKDNNGKPDVEKLRQNLKPIRSKTVYTYSLSILSLSGVMVIISHFVWNDPALVSEGNTIYPRLISTFIGCLFEFCVLVMLVVQKGFKDNLGFIKELRVTFFALSIPTMIFLVFQYILGPDNVISKDYGPNTILIAIIIYSRILIMYYLWKSSKSQKSINTVDYLIESILNRETFLKLKKVMMDDLCLENALYLEDIMKAHRDCDLDLRMIFAASGFKSLKMSTVKVLEDSDGTIHNPANNQCRLVGEIYKKFLVPESPFELNVFLNGSTNIKAKILDGTARLEDLTEVTDQVIQMIFQNNFHRYLKTESST